MNVIATLLILVCLAGSEQLNGTAAENPALRAFAVLLTASLVPAIAWLQTHLLLEQWQRENHSEAARLSLFRRMSVCHLLVWLAASTSIIWALHWQDVVRGNWQLDRWPLIDEVVILLPIIVPMLVSWAVFYPLQLAMQFSDSQNQTTRANLNGSNKPRLSDQWRLPFRKYFHSQIKARWKFVSIRFQVYFLAILIPLCAFLLVRDLAELSSGASPGIHGPFLIAMLVVLALLMPLLMLLVLRNSPIENEQLDLVLRETASAHRLRVIGLRTWETGRQVVNAVVVGWIPGLRMIFLSDGLLRNFPKSEITAVLRHEAGHIRLWHVPIRLFFLTTPWIVLLFALGRTGVLDENLTIDVSAMGIAAKSLFASSAILIAAVHYFLMRWLSHQMEFAADIYSIRSDTTSLTGWSNRPICNNRAVSLKHALLRLAAISPAELDRTTSFHPSIRDRIDFVEQIRKQPEQAHHFQIKFRRQRLALTFILAASGATILTLCG